MHVFSLGRFYASPKPSPRGEGGELCSPDEVERSRLPPAVPVSRQVPVPRHKPSPRGEGAELCSPDEVERSRLPPAVPVSRRVPVPRHKPSPRGEGGELCSPDAVEASRPIRRRRSRAASCVISCFQSSMLLHNLSRVFSLGKKASQRALRSSRVLLRTITTAHPAAASPHHAAPRPVDLHHVTPRPVDLHHVTPRPTVPHHATPRPAVPHHAAPRLTVPHHATPRPACPAPAPFPAAAGFPQTFHIVFHIFAGFPQRLSFPLAFLERDRVRSPESWVLPAA